MKRICLLFLIFAGLSKLVVSQEQLMPQPEITSSQFIFPTKVLQPKNINPNVYEYIVFGQDWTGRVGGFMHNQSSSSGFGDGDDFTIYSYGKDIYLNATGKKVAITGPTSIGGDKLEPGAMLTVNGTVHCQKVQVYMTAGAPDYVFEKDYNLRSLEETERYIKENSHLPEIPSAEEMEKEGINLLDLQFKLLQKIEELTLHTIEQNKRIKELEKEVNKK